MTPDDPTPEEIAEMCWQIRCEKGELPVEDERSGDVEECEPMEWED